MRVRERRQILQSVSRERRVPGGRELHLTYHLADAHPIPGILLLPDTAAKAPGAVLLHGYSSRKEHMSGPVGKALLAHGVASLALDLPLHGTRADPVQSQAARNPMGIMKLWRDALAEARLSLQYLAAHAAIDRTRLAMVGYSMGAFLAVSIAAEEPLVRAVVLAAGGDLPKDTPFTAIARMVADPVRSVKKLDGRPLLMVNGTRDHTIKPEQAERLFAAAEEPKELRWYDAGHYLPHEASDGAAAWLRDRLDGK